jgi:Flp pilus assembly protein TadG
VVFLLAAIAFDLSLLFLRQRQASSVAVDVANDLASAAFDEGSFRATGEFELDPERADELGRAFVAASDLSGDVEGVEIQILGTDRVEVRLTVRVDYLFADAIPGAADGSTVTAAATAQASLD